MQRIILLNKAQLTTTIEANIINLYANVLLSENVICLSINRAMH